MDDATDARVTRLATPHECFVFERNALERGRTDLAEQARDRGIELSAARDIDGDPEADGDPVLRVLWIALAACEYVAGRRLTGPRQSIRRRGLVGAGEHFVARANLPVSLEALAAAGLVDRSWESAVVAHDDRFARATVLRARERLDALETPAEAPADD